MSQLITFYSARSGSGKSFLIRYLAVYLADRGYRVGLLESERGDLLGYNGFPSGEPIDVVGYGLQDYLVGDCQINQIGQDITYDLDIDLPGEIFYFPFESQATRRPLHTVSYSQNAQYFGQSLTELDYHFDLDFLLVELGIYPNDVTFLTMLLADKALVLLLPDMQHYQSTAQALDLLKALECNQVFGVMNNVLPYRHNRTELKNRFEEIYQVPLLATVDFIPDFPDFSAREAMDRIEDPPFSQINHLADLLSRPVA